MMKFALCSLTTFFMSCTVSLTALAEDAPLERIQLWEGKAPLAMGDTEKDRPNITVYLPEKSKANGCGIVVCPGGGYGGLALGHEGTEIGEWLSSLGVTAFVLRYRLNPYRHPVPLMDVQRAMRTVRHNAKKWNVDPEHLGVLGFSAGGHLTSSIGTHFDKGDPNADNEIDKTSCRPDFLVLCYPVITLKDPHTHRGSRRNLLGETPDEKLVALMSNETQVTKETPPTFLMHTTEDKAVPVENSVLFYLALRKAGVPAEMHIYERGRHGVGLAKKLPGVSSWPKRCEEWLHMRGFLTPKSN